MEKPILGFFVIPMRPSYAPRLLSLSLLTLSLLACGGAGGLGSNSPSVSLSASRSSISYGQSVTIGWSSKKISSIESSNFRVGSSALDGSITDTPATTTTYKVTGYGEDGKRYSGSVTINVNKGPKTILFIGDTSQAGVNQQIEFVQGLTTQSVQVSGTVPSTISADVVILSNGANIKPSDRTAIQNQLNRGAGVVFVGDSPRMLATGDSNIYDISAIGSFFAGATRCDSGSYFDIVSSSPAGIPFGSTLLDVYEFIGGGVGPITSSATLLTSNSSGTFGGFLYSPSSGGRLAYVGQIPIEGDDAHTAVRALFLSEVRWASGE